MPQPDGVLQVTLDFVIPRYRDLKIGRFLFVEQAEFFRARGSGRSSLRRDPASLGIIW